jgi:hypothetical protein
MDEEAKRLEEGEKKAKMSEGFILSDKPEP